MVWHSAGDASVPPPFAGGASKAQLSASKIMAGRLLMREQSLKGELGLARAMGLYTQQLPTGGQQIIC